MLKILPVLVSWKPFTGIDRLQLCRDVLNGSRATRQVLWTYGQSMPSIFTSVDWPQLLQGSVPLSVVKLFVLSSRDAKFTVFESWTLVGLKDANYVSSTKWYEKQWTRNIKWTGRYIASYTCIRINFSQVADQLMLGKKVLPESYSCITVLMSDICGFTSFASSSTPIQVCSYFTYSVCTFKAILYFLNVNNFSNSWS